MTQHMITDKEREQIQRDLRDDAGDLWSKVTSEIDFSRNQVYFWLLVSGGEKLREAAARVVLIVGKYADNLPGVELNASFTELTNDKKIDWDHISDREIRKGVIRRPIGADPVERQRQPYTVFDLDS